MEKEPQPAEEQTASRSDESPPPFNPDPDIVTFLERGKKPDPKEVWKATERRDRHTH